MLAVAASAAVPWLRGVENHEPRLESVVTSQYRPIYLTFDATKFAHLVDDVLLLLRPYHRLDDQPDDDRPHDDIPLHEYMRDSSHPIGRL